MSQPPSLAPRSDGDYQDHRHQPDALHRGHLYPAYATTPAIPPPKPYGWWADIAPRLDESQREMMPIVIKAYDQLVERQQMEMSALQAEENTMVTARAIANVFLRDREIPEEERREKTKRAAWAFWEVWGKQVDPIHKRQRTWADWEEFVQDAALEAVKNLRLEWEEFTDEYERVFRSTWAEDNHEKYQEKIRLRDEEHNRQREEFLRGIGPLQYLPGTQVHGTPSTPHGQSTSIPSYTPPTPTQLHRKVSNGLDTESSSEESFSVSGELQLQPPPFSSGRRNGRLMAPTQDVHGGRRVENFKTCRKRQFQEVEDLRQQQELDLSHLPPQNESKFDYAQQRMLEWHNKQNLKMRRKHLNELQELADPNDFDEQREPVSTDPPNARLSHPSQSSNLKRARSLEARSSVSFWNKSKTHSPRYLLESDGDDAEISLLHRGPSPDTGRGITTGIVTRASVAGYQPAYAPLVSPDGCYERHSAPAALKSFAQEQRAGRGKTAPLSSELAPELQSLVPSWTVTKPTDSTPAETGSGGKIFGHSTAGAFPSPAVHNAGRGFGFRSFGKSGFSGAVLSNSQQQPAPVFHSTDRIPVMASNKTQSFLSTKPRARPSKWTTNIQKIRSFTGSGPESVPAFNIRTSNRVSRFPVNTFDSNEKSIFSASNPSSSRPSPRRAPLNEALLNASDSDEDDLAVGPHAPFSPEQPARIVPHSEVPQDASSSHGDEDVFLSPESFFEEPEEPEVSPFRFISPSRISSCNETLSDDFNAYGGEAGILDFGRSSAVPGELDVIPLGSSTGLSSVHPFPGPDLTTSHIFPYYERSPGTFNESPSADISTFSPLSFARPQHGPSPFPRPSSANGISGFWRGSLPEAKTSGEQTSKRTGLEVLDGRTNLEILPKRRRLNPFRSGDGVAVSRFVPGENSSTPKGARYQVRVGEPRAARAVSTKERMKRRLESMKMDPQTRTDWRRRVDNADTPEKIQMTKAMFFKDFPVGHPAENRVATPARKQGREVPYRDLPYYTPEGLSAPRLSVPAAVSRPLNTINFFDEVARNLPTQIPDFDLDDLGLSSAENARHSLPPTPPDSAKKNGQNRINWQPTFFDSDIVGTKRGTQGSSGKGTAPVGTGNSGRKEKQNSPPKRRRGPVTESRRPKKTGGTGSSNSSSDDDMSGFVDPDKRQPPGSEDDGWETPSSWSGNSFFGGDGTDDDDGARDPKAASYVSADDEEQSGEERREDTASETMETSDLDQGGEQEQPRERKRAVIEISSGSDSSPLTESENEVDMQREEEERGDDRQREVVMISGSDKWSDESEEDNRERDGSNGGDDDDGGGLGRRDAGSSYFGNEDDEENSDDDDDDDSPSDSESDDYGPSPSSSSDSPADHSHRHDHGSGSSSSNSSNSSDDEDSDNDKLPSYLKLALERYIAYWLLHDGITAAQHADWTRRLANCNQDEYGDVEDDVIEHLLLRQNERMKREDPELADWIWKRTEGDWCPGSNFHLTLYIDTPCDTREGGGCQVCRPQVAKGVTVDSQYKGPGT
ncbi:hypothetical protein IWX49DRAFT_592967 [Phyllosticta citricarpa]|uniref:Uncharacterized protein n=1 Tax=Phyllosticta citricarpa TaxID=55181 RepID=A0ABR1LZH4_9PEZI